MNFDWKPIMNIKPCVLMDTSQIRTVEQERKERDYCCGREIPGTKMILCRFNQLCHGQRWYHIECVNLQERPRGK